MNLVLDPYSASDLAGNPRLRAAFQRVTNGEMDVAVADLKDQVRLRLPGSAYLLAAIYFQTSRLLEAISLIEDSPDLATHSIAWTIAGVAHVHLRRAADAWRALRKALDLDWQNLQAHRWAWTALEMRGELDGALKLARSCIANWYSQPALPPCADTVELADVTLCAIDCVAPGLAARALRLSMHACRFGAVKLLTDADYRARDLEVVRIAHLGSSVAYSEFVIRELHRHISTRFALVTQWDGYIINPRAWSPAFLDFDYIGARWLPQTAGALGPGNRYDVGNGGFSLRSRRLLLAVAKLAKRPAAGNLHPEDALVCRDMRPQLEREFGIRFAAADLADRFSFEHHYTALPTFGFHGPINLAMAIKDPDFSRFQFLHG